jgi:hypothetical protein
VVSQDNKNINTVVQYISSPEIKRTKLFFNVSKNYPDLSFEHLFDPKPI